MLGLSLSIPFKSTMSGAGGLSFTSTNYEAIYNQFSTTPSDEDAAQQDIFVKALEDAGVWSELDRLFIFASHASGADSVIDWVNPAGTGATLVNPGDLTWTQYRGYTGGGTEGYINTGFTPSSDGVRWTRFDNSIFVYSRNVTALGIYSWGVWNAGFYADSFSNNVTTFRNTIYAQTTNSLTMDSGLVPASVPGMRLIDRIDSANVNLYLNGVDVTSDGNSGTAAAVTADIYALARSNNNSPVNYNDLELSMFGAGATLGSTKQLALYNAFQTLMTYYGTQV